MEEKKKTKSSAFYQKQYRDRLREMGLVKKEVWILPEYSDDLSEIEKIFRVPALHNKENIGLIEAKEVGMNNNELVWTTTELLNALSNDDFVKSNRASVELINGLTDCLHIVMHEFGDLPIFITASNQQILVESILWPVKWVKDTRKFNQDVLSLRKVFPLSTIGIERGGDGELNYLMYGALSATSLLKNIIYELETLADNVIKATEAYESYLDTTV